ncbi:MAG TPA: phage tail tape measure protein [Lachnospiraceae bacterium]|nr:phage tail tape measure protein [Lachnospiraceae bacterium]
MANDIKGITVKIGADTTDLGKAMSSANKEISATQKQLNEVEKALKLDPSNTELLSQKYRLLTEKVDETKNKLQTLKDAQAEVEQQYRNGEIDQGKYEAFRRELINTKNQLAELEREASQSNATMNSWGEKLKETGGKISSVGEAILPISGAVAGLGVAAAVSAVNFEDAMAKVSTIADTTEVPIDDLKTQILKLSSETGIAAGEIADNVYDAISAGQKTGDAVNFVANSTKLAKAGFADAGAALDVLTTIMNAYGLEAGEVNNVSDMLVQTQNLGKTTVAELSSSMGKIIPTANAYNVELDQLCTGYAKMTANGVATAESTTYMNSMLNELGKSGTGVSTILKEQTGKSFSELMEDGASLADVLAIVKQSADDQGLAFGDLWSSAEAGKAGLILLGDSADEFNGTLEQMRNSTGATDTAFEKLQTNSDKINKAVNDVKNTFIILGGTILDTFDPIISGLTEKIQALCSWISSLPTNVQQIIVIIGTVIAAAGPLLVMIGSVVSAVGTLLPVIGSVTAALSLPLAPIAAIVAALIGIGIAIADLYKNNEVFRENIQVIWNGLKEFFFTTLDFIKTNFAFVWNAIKVVIDTALGLIINIVQLFADLFRGDWDAISTDIQNIVTGLKDGIISYFTILKDGILNLITNVLYPKLLSIWESIKIGISQKVQSIKQDVSDKFNQMVSFITGLAGRFFDAGVSLFSNLWDGMISIWDSLWSWLDDCIESVKDALSFWRSSKDEMDEDADGSHAGGLDYVPFDGYKAILHKGERVLTAGENKNYNDHSTTNNGGNTSVEVTQNFYNSSENTARKEQKELQRIFRKLGLTGV